MENIHSHSYSIMIDTYIQDEQEKLNIFNSIKDIPSIKKIADWS